MADQWGMDGFGGPHPRVGMVDHSAFLGSAAVPHHVAGVLRVDQDLADGRAAPRIPTSLRIDVDRWRIPVAVGVEPIRDRGVTEPFGDPPGKDLLDNRAANRVRDQPVLGTAFGVPPAQDAGSCRVGSRMADVRHSNPVRCARRSRPRTFPVSRGCNHSATPCLTRRVSTVVARSRDSVIGSSAASSATPACSSSCSMRVP